MNGLSNTSLGLQETKRIHNAWKSRIHKFIQSPLPWKKISRQETNEASLLGESLEALLSQKRGRLAFREFLKSEFCEENLDFWLACEHFKSFDSQEELTRKAASIYEEFIEADSPKQVNIDFYTKEIISQSLQQPSPSCFVVAQRKIYSLMENGSFPRFIQSEQYKVLFDATSKPRGPGKHRKALKIKSTGDLIQHDSKPIILQSVKPNYDTLWPSVELMQLTVSHNCPSRYSTGGGCPWEVSDKARLCRFLCYGSEGDIYTAREEGQVNLL